MTKSGIKSFSDLPKIVAVDFDGTIVSDRYPNIGEPNTILVQQLKNLKHYGVKLILWTCRTDDIDRSYLQEAINKCKGLGLEFDAINTNIDEVKKLTGQDTRKVYADIYIDDKSVEVDILRVLEILKGAIDA